MMKGTCGNNVTWTLDGGTLTICGRGRMKNYRHWNVTGELWRQNIQAVVI